MPALGVRFDGLMLAEDGSLRHLIWSLDLQQSHFDFHKNGGRLIFVFFEKGCLDLNRKQHNYKKTAKSFSSMAKVELILGEGRWR